VRASSSPRAPPSCSSPGARGGRSELLPVVGSVGARAAASCLPSGGETACGGLSLPATAVEAPPRPNPCRSWAPTSSSESDPAAASGPSSPARGRQPELTRPGRGRGSAHHGRVPDPVGSLGKWAVSPQRRFCRFSVHRCEGGRRFLQKKRFPRFYFSFFVNQHAMSPIC
jgi:hypothetical protein